MISPRKGLKFFTRARGRPGHGMPANGTQGRDMQVRDMRGHDSSLHKKISFPLS